MMALRWPRGTLGRHAPGKRDDSGRRHGVVAGVLLVLSCVAASPAWADAHRRFLLIHSAHSTLVANVEVTAGIFSVLDEALGAEYEAFAEYRDEQRFPGPEADRAFLREMEAKYRGQSLTASSRSGLSRSGSRSSIGTTSSSMPSWSREGSPRRRSRGSTCLRTSTWSSATTRCPARWRSPAHFSPKRSGWW
jgi:hypothetical protein